MDKLTKRIVAFVKTRDWEQFHNPKDTAISLSLEAAEVLEHFQWKTAKEIKTYLKTHKKELGDELSDVLYWVLLMCYYFDIDVKEAFERKMLKNETKYPAHVVKGRPDKYTTYWKRKL
ncbi:nucleotide pyrophosphohydrolase [Candidatus Saccharibacteria bacterium]|nr:nucleotide pyrophosphohydrolase [Candidatus Saccharibacteria bacterium]